MQFKEAKWVEWGNGHSIANMAFGIQLTVYECDWEWIWRMGNDAFTLKHGKARNVFMAKIMAEHSFHRYVLENLDVCTE
jgi:hypothetical protein